MLNFIGFRKWPILDGHMHAPAGAAPEVIWAALTVSGATACNALSIPVLPVPEPRAGLPGPATLNAGTLRFKEASGGRAYAFCALDYASGDDFVAQVARLRAQGFDGLKMWEGKPSVYVHLPEPLTGKRYQALYAWMEAQRFPLLIHLADPPRFWDPARAGIERWFYADPRFPTRDALYDEMAWILKRHPGLCVILAHFAFLWNDLPRAARFLDAHPSAMLDLAPGVEGYIMLSEDHAAARDFFARYADRIIYGSDIGAGPVVDPAMPFDGDKEAGQAWLARAFLESDYDGALPADIGAVTSQFAGRRLRCLALPDDVLRRIYRLNFSQVVGPTPTEVA